MQVSTANVEQTFEDRLGDMLNPVQPDPAYYQQLKQRLSQRPTTVVETYPNQTLAFLIAVFGLAAGVWLIWLVRRLR